MSIRPLCVAPHPVLRMNAQPIQDFADDLRRLVRDLLDTMYANDGIGLAAPQIGRDVQVFIANPSQRRGRELIVVNPVLESAEGKAGVVEGCLSVPDIWGPVRRGTTVHLPGQDLSGKSVEVEAEGLLAITLQHELDHLQGRLFIDRLSWLRKRRVARRLRALGRARIPCV